MKNKLRYLLKQIIFLLQPYKLGEYVWAVYYSKDTRIMKVTKSPHKIKTIHVSIDDNANTNFCYTLSSKGKVFRGVDLFRNRELAYKRAERYNAGLLIIYSDRRKKKKLKPGKIVWYNFFGNIVKARFVGWSKVVDNVCYIDIIHGKLSKNNVSVAVDDVYISLSEAVKLSKYKEHIRNGVL